MNKQTKKKIKKNLKGGNPLIAAGLLATAGLTGAGLSTGLTNSNTSDSDTADSNNLGFNNNALTEILGTPIGDLYRITLKKYLIAIQNGMCTKKLEADVKNVINRLQTTTQESAPKENSELEESGAQESGEEESGAQESGQDDKVNTILNQLANGDKNIQQTLEEIQKITTTAKQLDKALKKAERVVPTFSDKLKSNFSYFYPKKAQKVKEYEESLKKAKNDIIDRNKEAVKKQFNILGQGGKKYSKKNKKHKKINKKYFKNITNKKKVKNYNKTMKKYKKYRK